MGKIVNLNLNQGIDSMVRIVSYLRRKEIEISSLDMKKQSEMVVNVSMEFREEDSIDNIVKHLSKLHDVENIKVL